VNECAQIQAPTGRNQETTCNMKEQLRKLILFIAIDVPAILEKIRKKAESLVIK
jgi:hypothetical protein